MALAFCTSPHTLCITVSSFIYLSSLLLEICSGKHTIVKIIKRNNSEITCDRVAVLVLCTSSDGHLSMYHISFNSLLYFQRYAPDQLFITKIKKGSNSINTGDRAMVLAFPFMALYQCIKFHSFIFNTFRDMLRTSLLLQKLERVITL